MTSVKVSQMREPDEATIKQMVHIYHEAYKSNKSVQLTYIIPELTERMAETIANRVKKPECDFILARGEGSNQLVGWLALAYKLGRIQQLSEEHVLFTQYALLPDIVAKGKSRAIGTDEMKALAYQLFMDFKNEREKQLPDKHCILSTLVVSPAFQNTGVASALLSKAISLTEVFIFPIWVQAPEACHALFKRHHFEEVGEYYLDLNEHLPELEGKGKGKAKAAAPLEKYVWKYMVRKEPLEQALEAYRSSKVCAELEGEQIMEGLGYGERMLAWFCKAFASYQMEPRPTASLLGKDKRSTSGETPLLGKDKRPASEESPVTPSRAGAGPSTPPLVKSSSKGGKKLGAKEEAARKANAPRDDRYRFWS